MIIIIVVGVGVGGLYLWSIGEIIVFINVSFVNIEIFVVIVINVNGCIDIVFVIVIEVLELVVIVVLVEFCEGEIIILIVSGGVSYQWDVNVGNVIIVSVDVIFFSIIQYFVMVINELGCMVVVDVIIGVLVMLVIMSVDVV